MKDKLDQYEYKLDMNKQDIGYISSPCEFDVSNLLTKLTSAVSFHYKNSHVAPGVTISYLPTKEFYVSIIQYGASHRDKKVMHKVKDYSLERAIKAVTREFLNSISIERNPIDELKDIMK